MFSKYATRQLKPARWSLTARLTTFFAMAISLMVISVSAMMYAELAHQLQEKAESELLEDLHSQQEIRRLASLRRREAPTQANERDLQNDNAEFAWQAIGARGEVNDASDNARGLPAHFGETIPPGHFARRTVETDSGVKTYLVISLPEQIGTQAHMLRGALDVTQDEQIKQRYLGKLLAVLVIMIGTSVVAGWLLVWRGLAPVRSISAQIGRINAERLHTRIAQETWPAELRSLAQTFDTMMASIERAFDQLSRFSSDLAHEFRSPINNLVAAASVMLGRDRSAQEYQATLAVIVEEGDRLSRMVSSMLFLARADNASQVLRVEPVASTTEFGKLVDFFGIVADDLGVSLVATGDVTLCADPLLLRQALSNMLENALRYTKQGCAITLCAEEKGAEIVLSVTDDGVGIAPEHLPFLFDRFYRADPARSGNDSSGLGLAVVQSIAQLHGGRVAVHSLIGKGSRFEICLPRHSPAGG